MKLAFPIALGAALMMAPCGVALAQPASRRHGLQGRYRQAVRKFPHNGSVRACLTKHESEVSPACKQALNTTGGGRMRKQ